MKASIASCVRKFLCHDISTINVFRTQQIRCCQQDITDNLTTSAKCGLSDKHTPNLSGKILQKNLESEWWKIFESTSDFKVLDTELDIKEHAENHEPNSLLQQLMPHMNSSKGVLFAARFYNEMNDKRRKHLIIAYPCNHVGKIKIQDIRLQQLRFIKNFFNDPGRIAVNSINAENCVTDHHQIIYNAEDVDFNLQEIMKYSHEQVSATVIALNLQQMRLAIMKDAIRNRNNQMYLKLHHKLAPIKTVVFHEFEKGEESMKLSQLVEEICVMLRSSNITCWNGATKGLTLTDADGLGAPFSVIIPDSVLENGILYIRDQNTTVNMEVHISLLAEKLLKYLQA